ncbi:hypothetical protein ACI65C_012704 [Semiaphis heraclei]
MTTPNSYASKRPTSPAETKVSNGHKPRLLWTFDDDVAARPAGSTVVAHNSRTPSRTYNDSMAHLQRT